MDGDLFAEGWKDDDEMDPLLMNPQKGEVENGWINRINRYRTKVSSKFTDALRRRFRTYRERGGGYNIIEEYEMGDIDEGGKQPKVRVFDKTEVVDGSTSFTEREERINEAEKKIRDVYTEWDPSKSNFIFGIDEYGRVEVRLKSKGSKIYHLSDGKWDGDLPESIEKSLGLSTEDKEQHKRGVEIVRSRYPENTLTKDNEFQLGFDDNTKKLIVTHDSLKMV